MLDASRHRDLPARPGVGYKPQHFADILKDAGPVEWLEIHAENYMGAGGRPLAQLRHLAERFPMSVHGVGLCIGASIEFLSGAKRRAPLWVRRLRIEWAFRLASEPRRLWRRYLIEGPRIFAIWRDWKRQRQA